MQARNMYRVPSTPEPRDPLLEFTQDAPYNPPDDLDGPANYVAQTPSRGFFSDLVVTLPPPNLSAFMSAPHTATTPFRFTAGAVSSPANLPTRHSDAPRDNTTAAPTPFTAPFQFTAGAVSSPSNPSADSPGGGALSPDTNTLIDLALLQSSNNSEIMPALLNTTAPVQLTAWAANTTAGESRKRRPQEAAAGAAAKRQPAKDSLPDATIYRKRYTKAELLETATALVERHNQGSAPQELQMLADNALAAYAITPLSVAVHQINTSALVDKKSAGRYRGRDTGLEFLRLVDEYYKKTRHGHLADAEMFLEMLAYLRNKYTR